MAVEACLLAQIVDYSILLATEEDHQALGMILRLDLLDQGCSLPRMDQGQVICILSSLEPILLEAREALLIPLHLEEDQVEVDSTIHSVDQDEEEADLEDQAEVEWVAGLVGLEEASAEAVASEVAVDLVDLAETCLETINIINL